MNKLWRKLFPVRVEYINNPYPVAQMIQHQDSVYVLYPNGNLYKLFHDRTIEQTIVQRIGIVNR